MNNELHDLEDKLQDLRERWLKGSPALRKYLEAGGKLLKAKRDKLVAKNGAK